MPDYRVTWSIDVEADSPEEAATQALIIQRDNHPDNAATVFDVLSPDGHEETVDLGEIVCPQ